jgi:pilus assembly protein FimV
VMWQETSPNRALFDTPEAGEDEDAPTDTSGGGVLNIAAGDDGLDFDLDDESDDLIGLDLSGAVNDLDISDHNVESDDDSDSIDMESTVQMPLASVDSLIMAEDDDDDKTFLVPKSTDVDEQSVDEEMASQLDLAKAYIELGDTDNAKTILDEIISQGSDDYRKQAEELIGQID